MLCEVLRGSVGFLGIGNIDRADDGAGMVLARLLRELGTSDVFEGGTTPERIAPALRKGAYDTIVFLDAVEAGLEPGAVIILNAEEIKSRFPQVSTHKLSLATLAGLVSEGKTNSVWLIGIQAQTITMGNATLSDAVNSTIHLLAGRIAQATAAPVRAYREQLCI